MTAHHSVRVEFESTRAIDVATGRTPPVGRGSGRLASEAGGLECPKWALNGAILIVLGRVAADPDRAFADRRSGLGEELSNHAEKGERAIRLREIGRRPGILRPLLVAT